MKRRMLSTVIATAALIVMACSATADQEQAPDFGSYWHDGKAELDGYKLTISRYGQTRHGHAVAVYVTEPMSEAKRVKVNDYTKNPEGNFDALKLNLIRDFQTGIYDYNTMVSTWVRTSNLAPVKLSFHSTEWCGHVYLDLIVDPGRIAGNYYSYFEGETGPIELRGPEDGVMEDNLFIRLRGLQGDYLAPGESERVEYLPGALYTRFNHTDLAWTKATITRAKDTESVTVPAGTYDAMVYTVAVDGGRTGTFFVDSHYPHRIVKWSLDPDISVELTGSARLEYWKLHDEGDESYLTQIGLGDLIHGSK